MDQSNEIKRAWEQFIANGDKDALSLVYFAYYDRLLTYGMKHTSDMQLVEDTIQSVFLNLINQRNGIGQVRSLCGYLFSAFRYEMIRNLKKNKRILFGEDNQIEYFNYFISSEQESSGEGHNDMIHQKVKESVNKLPDRQKEIMFLRFENDISYEEISEMLNISIDSCYKSVYRSIKAIRKNIEKIPSRIQKDV